MTESSTGNETQTGSGGMIFGIDSPPVVESDGSWYMGHIDVVFPVIIIGIGLFQFILRKWILPVSEEVISELEDGFPSQGLLYVPGLGVFLMVLGLVLLIAFLVW